MHARRYFVRSFEHHELLASKPIELIGQLYASEAASKAAGEWPHERMLRRQRLAKPVLEELKAWLDEHEGKVPPKSLLGKAITYALNHWTALCRPLENAMLELDNGDVERTMRGPAMGRKNCSSPAPTKAPSALPFFAPCSSLPLATSSTSASLCAT
jgi:transposase